MENSSHERCVYSLLALKIPLGRRLHAKPCLRNQLDRQVPAGVASLRMQSVCCEIWVARDIVKPNTLVAPDDAIRENVR